MKRFFNYGRAVVLALMAFCCSTASMAQDEPEQKPVYIDVYTYGHLKAVMKGGTLTSEAGVVFASAEAVSSEADIHAVASESKSDVTKMTGEAGTSEVNRTYYFYAKANPGYKFLGFTSSISGTPSGSGVAKEETKVGDYYMYSAKIGTQYFPNTEDKPKAMVRYAIFEKSAPTGPVVEDGFVRDDIDQLPKYTVNTPASQNVRSLYTFTIDMTGDYDEPFSLMPKIGMVKVKKGSTVLTNTATASVEDGKLTITVNPSITEAGEYTVTIPAGLVNNLLLPVAAMTTDELISEGFCTNPEMELTFNVTPEKIKVIKVTNQSGFDLNGTVVPLAVADENSGEVLSGEIITHIYLWMEEELASTVKASEFKNYVSIKAPHNRKIDFNAYSCGLKEVNGVNHSIIDIFLSVDSHIDSAGNEEVAGHTGTYDVTVKEGLGQSFDGLPTEAFNFTFEYKDMANDPTVINKTVAPANARTAYNLAGQRVAKATGITIIDGKKVIK